MSNKVKSEDENGERQRDSQSSRRRFLKQAASAGIGVAIVSEIAERRVQASDPLIYAYPGRSSVVPGETLLLHYLTNRQFFRVRIYRQGRDPAPIFMGLDTGWRQADPAEDFIPRNNQPNVPADPSTDWNWPATSIQIPGHWQSGAYIAMFFTSDDQWSSFAASNQPHNGVGTPDGRFGKALFVVKSANPGSSTNILYKLSLTTYHAYNIAMESGNYSSGMYTNTQLRTSGGNVGFKVTMLRPGGGTGGYVTKVREVGPDDIHDPSSPMNCFSHWDPYMIAWLERNNYTVDYCTDLDVHLERPLLSRYGILLSVGHDEYWSQRMRDNVDWFVRQGGNVAFFSGNPCYWRINFTDFQGGIPTAFTCDKRCVGVTGPPDCVYPHADGRETWWRLGLPENTLTGVSTRNAGDSVSGEGTEPQGGYTVQHANAPDDSWVYAGTGLINGAQFGEPDALLAYECDGAEYTAVGSVKQPTGRDGTPANFMILGYYPTTPGTNYPGTGPGWTYYPRETQLVNEHAATMGFYTNIGTVFTGATTGWSRVLNDNNTPEVNKITDNVIKGLTTPLKAVAAARFENPNRFDIVFQNTANAQPSIWYLNGPTVTGSRYASHRQELNWSLRAVADFNGDGKPDFVFYDAVTGQTTIWQMDNFNFIAEQLVSGSQNPAWTLVAAADFNNDGHPDLVFYNPSTGQIRVWYMNGSSFVSEENVNLQQGAGWALVAASDFDNNNKSDLIFQHEDGSMTIWYLDGTSFVRSQGVEPLQDTAWRLVTAADFSGNGVPDLLFQHRVTNELMIWYMAYDQTTAAPVSVHQVNATPTRGQTPVPNGARPTSLVARATSTMLVTLSWVAPASAPVSHYEVERSSSINGPYTQLTSNTTTTIFTDMAASPGVAYLYRVRAVFTSGDASAYSNLELATTVNFTNNPLSPGGTIIKGIHLIELRQAVNAVRTLAGVGAATWTYPDPPQQPPGRLIYFEDVQELRVELDEALGPLGLVKPYPPEPALARSMAISAAHFEQIRERVG
jgi:hypothetical protein